MSIEVLHPLNFQIGWSLVLAGFLVGALVGLSFHRVEFLGGYSSFPRRMIRLGHVALVALGGLNVLAAICVPVSPWQGWALILLLVGGISMPTLCFLTAWRRSFRHLFFIPVLSLIAGVCCILIGGTP